MAGAGESSLFSSDDCSLWRAALESYPKVLELKEAERNGKKSKVKKESIMKLDKW